MICELRSMWEDYWQVPEMLCSKSTSIDIKLAESWVSNYHRASKDEMDRNNVYIRGMSITGAEGCSRQNARNEPIKTSSNDVCCLGGRN